MSSTIPQAPEVSVISVLLVDDSLVVQEVLKKILADSPLVRVIGTAGDGREGLAAIARHDPDVVLLDLSMPQMDGYAMLQQMAGLYPRPILVVSKSVQPTDAETMFRLMKIAQDIDFFPKPTSDSADDYQKLQPLLVAKIRALAMQSSRRKA